MSSASAALRARSSPSRTRSIPMRRGGACAASCTVATRSFPMATPNSLTPCSAPHSQVGQESRAAWAPVSPIERYWVRRMQPAVGRRPNGTASWTSPTGTVRVLGEDHAPHARPAQRVAHGCSIRSVTRVTFVEARQVLTLDQIDLSDIEFWARPWAEREGAFQLLRRERPLAFFEEPELPEELALVMPKGPGYRAVTRHADVAEVSRHPELYRSGQGATSIPDMPEEMLEYFGSMISTDNPRHARLRRIVSAAFNPRMIKRIEEHIELVAGSVIDRVAGLGGCDFVVEVAARLPLEIICEMMGIGPADYSAVFNASNIILSQGDPEYVPEGADPLLAFMTAAQDLTALMAELAETRRVTPTDDVTSALVNTNIDGESLTAAEVASFFVLLVVAGNETTRNAISHGLLALTEHPDQRALWQADPAGIAPTGVDEIVRWGSPVVWMRRTVAEDTVLGGEELHPGDKLILFYNSANRDEDVFADPYRFDVRRSPNPHLGFGAAGPHFCLGAHLARQEIDVMFRQLFERLPDIESAGEPDRLRSSFINGIKHMDCTFTPVAPAR